jgi:hypothetical protein
MERSLGTNEGRVERIREFKEEKRKRERVEEIGLEFYSPTFPVL